MPSQRKKRSADDARMTKTGGESIASKPPLADERPSSDEAIQLRAYELYVERGGHEGDAVADWLQAEREHGDGRVGEQEGRQDEANLS